jgi:exonuclease III
MILDQVLNTNGVSKYRKAVSFNFANSYIVNQMYYNSEKLALYEQDVVRTIYRDIDVYTLYYKAGDLGETHDTIFLSCFVAHLKAGQDNSDANSRAEMVTDAMDYIRTNDLSDNLLFMGDLNLYTSSEEAYSKLTDTYSGERYFYDPIDREGNWNNNSSYKDVHTQSTHANNVDCFSYGGLDDRFDFILASSDILSGNSGAQMINNSYEALGNDGQHFNKRITDSPTNTSAPADIINALYGMSDHLPVLAKIKVDASLSIKEWNNPIAAIKFKNPNKGSFNLQINLEEVQTIKISVFDLFGKLRFQNIIEKGSLSIQEQLNLEYLSEGTYLLCIEDELGNRSTRKFFIIK